MKKVIPKSFDKKIIIGIASLASACFFANTLSAADGKRVPTLQQPGLYEVYDTSNTAKDGKQIAEAKLLSRRLCYNVRVIPAADGKSVSYVYLDEFGEPYENQKDWAELAAGAPLPVEARQPFFSEDAPNPSELAMQMHTWQVVSQSKPGFFRTTYSTGFSGDAEYFKHAFTANGAYVLTARLQGNVSMSVSSDDTAALSIGDYSCSSTLHNDGAASGPLPAGTTSLPISWSYENIGGPFYLSISFVVDRVE